MTHVFPSNTLNNYFDTRFKFICDSIVISQTKSRKKEFGSITERGTNQFSQRFRLVIPAMAKSKMHTRRRYERVKVSHVRVLWWISSRLGKKPAFCRNE